MTFMSRSLRVLRQTWIGVCQCESKTDCLFKHWQSQWHTTCQTERVGTLVGITLLLFFPVANAMAQTPPAIAERPMAAQTVPKANAAELPWQETLAAGYRQSLTKQAPIFVKVGGEACPWCRKLDQEIKNPLVQKELARWTLVSLDVEKSFEEVRPLNVGPIPALRILSPRGRLVASHEGYLTAEEFLEWLKTHHDAAKGVPDALLLATDEPNVVAVAKLIKRFEDKSAADREAAVRRLLPYPGVAREPIIQAFREGNLSVKLTALELLTEWKAPIEGLDPWQKGTFTVERLAALETWSKEFKLETLDQKPQPLSEQKLTNAQRDIQSMIAAAPEDALAIRERLARLGEPLIPETSRQLQSAPTDLVRERLLALRYRLVAEETLSLRWPGGLERLASTDVAVRRKAADELSKMSVASDQRLLLELFSDADPLVREISLKGLKAVGGKEATKTLINLLKDPEPNIRAAVLKQLAVEPSLELAGDVARYAQTETDADLLVHALRFFRETESADVIEHLLPHLENSHWQVRAEATESIAKIVKQDYDSRETLASESSEVYKRMVKLLEDPDSFVVAKALEYLQMVNTAASVEPLVKSGGKHPSLIPHIIKIFGSQSNMHQAALPYIKQYFKSDKPSVRAAAVNGLFLTDRAHVKEMLPAALADEASEVRIAAAETVLAILTEKRPAPESFAAKMTGEILEEPQEETGVLARVLNAFAKPNPVKPVVNPAVAETPAARSDLSPSPWDEWLLAIRRGQHREQGMDSLVPPLETMLSSPHPSEQTAAGLALVPLGKSEAAIPVILEAAGKNHDAYLKATLVLSWLPYAERKTVFERLADIARNTAELTELATNMNGIIDQRSAPLLWGLLQRKEASLGFAESLRVELTRTYYGQRYWDTSSLSAKDRRQIADSVKPYAQKGSSLTRLVALSFLMSHAQGEAIEIAKGLLTDPDIDETLRADAFQILLIGQPESDRMQTVIEALGEESPDKKKVALAYLALGSSALTTLRGSGFVIEQSNELSLSGSMGYSSSPAGRPIIPDPPKGLSLENVKPLFADGDPETAAQAGYLAALFGDADGLNLLLGYWHSLAEPTALWDRLVYRAIANLDHTESVPLLKEIYARRETTGLDPADFYWTIRIMSGAEILEFRKKVREEIGMDNLGSGASRFLP